jgi:hypothetical protein
MTPGPESSKTALADRGERSEAKLPRTDAMTASHAWAFRTTLRRGAFGWSGTAKAVERLNAALAEIAAVARTDPALAGEGAVLLLEKVSPAVSEIDSSSGALGNATYSLVETLVPIIAAAPVAALLRQKWLDRLLAAYQEDDPPYIESLGMHWGSVCASPTLASRCADDLLPSVLGGMADRRRGVYAFSKATTPCLSALFTAGRFDELEQLLALDPKPFWNDQQWKAKVHAARGDVDGAIRVIEAMRGPYAPDAALSALAEQMLHEAGRGEEAYARYAIAAHSAHTHIATYRAIAKRYPSIDAQRILGDLIASTPGQEGKWFATAKTLKQFDLALALAQRSAVEPKTLVRAARDHQKTQPAFALEVALAALQWMARGAGYEITSAEVSAARDHALAAGQALPPGAQQQDAQVLKRIAECVAGPAPAARWVRQCLGLPLTD